MKRDANLCIADALESIQKIRQYTAAITQQEFCENTQIQDAVFRRLEIIGEVVKNIPDALKAGQPDIPWRKVAGLRDVLIHVYIGVNFERVWSVIENDLDKLSNALEKMAGELNKQAGRPPTARPADQTAICQTMIGSVSSSRLHLSA